MQPRCGQQTVGPVEGQELFCCLDQFMEGEDFYVHVTALISCCKSAQRDEYKKSNFAACGGFKTSLQLNNERVRKMRSRWKDVFGALLPTATVEKWVCMDLKLLSNQSAWMRCRWFPANAEDTKEIMRQIYQWVSSDLAEEYTKTDFPKHCSPCYLVAKPGGSAKGLLVHYGKLNKLTKRHFGTLTSLERALERASACQYKNKLDKRSGSWQVELTKRAQDLSAFVAPNGQVFKWKSMPCGLPMAPTTFQELMNQVLQRMKRKATVQDLLTCGAFIEAYIDDGLLGVDTVEDQLKLLEKFMRTCDECHTKVKLSKCECMKESLEYLAMVEKREGQGCADTEKPQSRTTTHEESKISALSLVHATFTCNFYKFHIL